MTVCAKDQRTEENIKTNRKCMHVFNTLSEVSNFTQFQKDLFNHSESFNTNIISKASLFYQNLLLNPVNFVL